MKNGKVWLALALLLCLLIGLTCGAAAEEESYRIGILQLIEHTALDAANQGFLDALADNGLIEGKNLTIGQQNASGDQATLQLMAEQLKNGEYDLYLGIATGAVQALSAQIQDKPILGTAVTDYVAAGLVASNEAPGINVSGTTDMNPIDLQIELLVKLLPDAKVVGICYTSSEVNSQIQAEIAKEEAEKWGLEVVVKTISAVGEVQQAIESLVSQADVLYLPTDNIIASAMAIVSDVTLASGTPTIVGEENMCAGGGLATVGLNYYDLGYQTGLMALRILREGANPAEMPIESLAQAGLCFNADTAAALSIELPEDLVDSATIIGAIVNN